MTKDEFKNIVKKFNDDKVNFNWIEIVKNFKNFTTHVYEKYIENKPKYYNFNSGKEFKYWIEHSNDEDFCKKRFCPICGEFITNIIRKKWFYAKTCCEEHAQKLGRINAEKTNIEKFGHKSPMNCVEISNKVKDFWKNRSEEEIINHVEKIKQKKLKNHGNENYNNRDKAKKTFLKRYRVDNPLKNEDIKEKVKQTNLKKYDCVAPIQNEKIMDKVKKTCLKKYGVEKIGNCEKIREKINKTMKEKYNGSGMKSELIRNKIEATNEIRYGNKIPLKNKFVIEKMKRNNVKKYGVDYPLQNKEIFHKTISARRKNGTLNTSHNFEDKIINLLKEKYPEYTILTQYYDERYPFNCDCYIKELDLFIEFQGLYYHHNRPFNESEEDILEYNRLVQKGGQKETIANTWRYRDVEKRKFAIENKLNYFEYWENMNFNISDPIERWKSLNQSSSS